MSANSLRVVCDIYTDASDYPFDVTVFMIIEFYSYLFPRLTQRTTGVIYLTIFFDLITFTSLVRLCLRKSSAWPVR